VLRRIAVLVALSLALVGCGGGSKTSSSNARREFIARANSICRSARENAKPLGAGLKRLDPKAWDATVALLDRTAKKLAVVKPPPDLQAGYQRFLALANEEIGAVAKLARYLREGNVAAIRSLEGELNSHALDDQARRLGLSVCAEEEAL
jgi:hypothetical protein